MKQLNPTKSGLKTEYILVKRRHTNCQLCTKNIKFLNYEENANQTSNDILLLAS